LSRYVAWEASGKCSKIYSDISFPPNLTFFIPKSFYRKGRVAEALRDWTRLDQYGPAYLSRVCHAIYMQQPHDTKEGRCILRQAQQLQLEKGSAIKLLPTKEVQKMKLDAQAIVNGNLMMVDMNARLAKQEYLGVASL
jgi:lipopolysaccharide biosynthesis regulator YciM